MISPIYKEPTEKMIKLFDAVAALLEEGADVKDLKVIDITERAGIGKGTAYEYFKSKEELLLEAQIYYFDQKVKWLCRQVGKAGTFSDAIDACCTAIDDMLHNEAGMRVLFRYALGGMEEGSEKRRCEDNEGMDVFFAGLVKLGRQDGLFANSDDEQVINTLVTELVGYGITCNMWQKRHPAVDGYQEFQKKNRAYCKKAIRAILETGE
ncbi:transcriptional regulator, TetR family [Lachnospiraceae bacterium XBB1006]|nr:transcriptional regulator, TetR family [Lachnospiraceae bacterium XBB1006]